LYKVKLAASGLAAADRCAAHRGPVGRRATGFPLADPPLRPASIVAATDRSLKAFAAVRCWLVRVAWIVLPLAVSVFPERGVQAHKKAQRSLARWVRGVNFAEPPEQFKGLRVVIIDDDARNREVLSELLTLFGAQISACESGAEALRLIPKFGSDLILCDVAMPDMDGYDLMRAVRRLPRESGGDTPAVAVTGIGESAREQAFEAGFQALLSKPVEWDRLVATLRAILGSRGPPLPAQ
jgi:CheY-like chemotaxis protein